MNKEDIPETGRGEWKYFGPLEGITMVEVVRLALFRFLKNRVLNAFLAVFKMPIMR